MVAINPDRSRSHTVRDRVCLLDIPCPHARGESISGAVGPGDDLVHILKGNNAHNRTKNFFPRNFHLISNVGEHRRLNEVSTVSDPLAAAGKGRSFALSSLDVTHDSVKL